MRMKHKLDLKKKYNKNNKYNTDNGQSNKILKDYHYKNKARNLKRKLLIDYKNRLAFKGRRKINMVKTGNAIHYVIKEEKKFK